MSDVINLVLIPVLMFLGILLGRAKLGLKSSHLEFLIIYFTAPVLLFAEMLNTVNLNAAANLGDLLADPTGETLFAGIDPTDPSFAVAAAACQDLIGDL